MLSPQVPGSPPPMTQCERLMDWLSDPQRKQSGVILPEPVSCVVESSRKVIRRGLTMPGSDTDCQATC